MKALVFRKSVPRYVLLKTLGPWFRRLYTSGMAPVSLLEISEPRLPNAHWLRIRPKLAGICGSDLATLCAKGSPYLAPVTSPPFVMGHEVVGTVTEVGAQVSRVRAGDRVVLRPVLGCHVRGINPLCDHCAGGQDALCRNVTRGVISAGLQTGFCRDTGGGFGESFVAHEAQVYPVPTSMDDRAAVLVEPFACALHAVLRVPTTAGQTVLIIGCGAIGLLTIAALRATGCRARIVAIAKYEHQRQHALALGADELLEAGGGFKERYPAWARMLGAELLRAEIGKPAVIGGADVTFDCIASSRSIDEGLRFTRGGGTFVLVGMPGIPWGVDWTPLWYKELTMHASYAYGPESGRDRVRDTFEMAIELIETWGEKLSHLISRPFELGEYRAALDGAIHTGRSRTVKTVFAINQ